MAVGKSGYIDVTVMPQSVGKVRVFWREDYNVEGNYSTITITNIQGCLGHRIGWTYASVMMSIDGTAFYGPSSKKWVFSASEDSTLRDVVLASDLETKFAAGESSPTSHKIYHNNDGTKTISLKFTLVDCWCSSVGFDATNNQATTKSIALTSIPRASELSAENGTLGIEQNLTVTKKASGYTHTITYSCGDALGTVCTKSSDTTVPWTPPIGLAAQNTTGQNVIVVFKLQTYNGDVMIGNPVTKTVYMYIPLSVVPTATIAVTDPTGYLSTYGGYVQGQSKMRVVTTPTLAYNSPISTYNVTADENIYNAADVTTGIIKNSGEQTVKSQVIDGRGRGYTAQTKINVLPYTSPVITKLTVHRCNSDGTENYLGEYAKITYSFAITSLSDKNAKNIILRYKKSSETAYTSVTLTSVYSATDSTYIFAADDGSSYDVILTVTDAFNSANPATRKTSVSTAQVLMHWKSTGNGMGIGKIAETEGVFDVKWAAKFRSTLDVMSGRLELNQNGTFEDYGGYIDFHYNGSTDDYTSRIIEDGNGKLNILAPNGVRINSKTILDTIYPVGSIVIRYDHTSPASIYGGTWTRISPYFLYATGGDGVIGETGGDAAVTLTEAQLPNITGDIHGGAGDSSTGYGIFRGSSGAFSNGMEMAHRPDMSDAGYWAGNSANKSYYGVHMSFGGGESHPNIPPFIKVSVWRRTA